MSQHVAHDRTIIFDYDETITPRYVEKDRMFAEAAARILVDFHAASGKPMTLAEAVQLTTQSVIDHGTELAIVERLTGHDPADVFLTYHRHAFPAISSYLTPDAELKAALETAGQAHNLTVLSHGPQDWVEQGLGLLGLRDIFDTQAVFGLDHPLVNFRRKNAAADLYTDVLAPGHALGNAVLIDDALSNIKFAHALGLQTVHINHDMRDIAWAQSAPDLKAALKLIR